jgi:probable O-glycosylation ligase (exosortase A-associated)
MDAPRNTASRDAWAFAAITAFVVQLYTIPSEWIPVMAPLRLALVLSTLGACLLLLRRLGRMDPVYFDGKRGGALLGFAAVAVASVIWSVNPTVTRPWTVELLKLVAIYLTVVNVVTTPRRLAILCGALVLASIVTSIGVIHWYHVGVDLVEGFRARWVGIYADPNHMAENLGIVLPLAAAFLVRKATPMWMRALCLVAAGLATVAIVESHSRGGFLGITAAMAVWTLRETQHRMKAIGAAVVLAVGLALFAPKSYWERNDTLQNFQEDASALGRVYAWHVASAISLDRPLLGVGGGAFRYAWADYAPPEAKQAFVAHNIYLDVIGELGWIGLFLFLIFSGGACGGAFAASLDPERGWLARGLFAAMVGYLLCNCFSGYTLSAHLYVLFGLAACAERIAAPLQAPS